jgi:hypothetical protein
MAPLSPLDVVDQAQRLLEVREKDRDRLDRLYLYANNQQRFLWLPPTPPVEVQKIAAMSRVNVLGLVVDSAVQSMYVDGYRAPNTKGEAPAWEVWQRNRMDARQIGVHRATITYGVAYTSVLPGSPVPVIKGHSPRDLTTVYGEAEDWPVWALERRRSASAGKALFRLFDDEYAYWLEAEDSGPGGRVAFKNFEQHGTGVVPFVRFLARSDLDAGIRSELEDLIYLQDQIDLTTFGLLVVQHYGAFPQKWITGWLAETDQQKLEVSVKKVLTIEDPDAKLGQFQAAALDGYIESRKDSLRLLASISQTPAHALRGELVNLSAEALAAAEAGERRKVTERETMAGESWEQTLELAGTTGRYQTDPLAQVRWKDTEARAFAATVDGLSKLAALGVPLEMIMERVPNWTQDDVERAKDLMKAGDPFAQLSATLDRQAATVPVV